MAVCKAPNTRKVFTGRLQVVVAALLLCGLQFLSVPRVHATMSAPLASYSFDRATTYDASTLKPVFLDESGHGNDCNSPVNSNNISAKPGHTNLSIYTNSSGVRVDCANKNLKPTTALTVMAWIKAPAGSYNRTPVLMQKDASSDTWALYAGDDNYFYTAQLTTVNATVTLHSGVSVPGGNWNHVALTYDGSNAKLYVDGVLKDTQPLTGNIDYGGNTYPLNIFDDQISGNDFFNGYIDDLRVYGSALSGSEVQTMMNTPVGTFYSNTNGRSVAMSSSLPSATNVTYSVGFKVDSTYSLRTVIADFCSNSPIAGQSCSAPGGFTVSGAPTIANFKINGAAAPGTWTGGSQNSGRTLVVTGSTGVSVTTGDMVTFDVTTVTNPNGVGSFYGRLLTYNFASPTYSATSTDNFKETGGVALSTANGVGFIFQVPETLQFCVYQTTCGDAPVVVLGHGPSTAIDSSQIDTGTAKFSITTNALGGAVVYGNGYPPMLSPSRWLAPLSPNGSQTTMVAGNEAFGMRIAPFNGVIAANYCYRDFGGDDYCYDTNMMPPPDGVGLTELTRQDTPGPISAQELTMTFAATASNTTPGGTYQTAISLIAVGTF